MVWNTYSCFYLTNDLVPCESHRELFLFGLVWFLVFEPLCPRLGQTKHVSKMTLSYWSSWLCDLSAEIAVVLHHTQSMLYNAVPTEFTNSLSPPFLKEFSLIGLLNLHKYINMSLGIKDILDSQDLSLSTNWNLLISYVKLCVCTYVYVCMR